VTPRPYQLRTLDACRDHFRAGKRAVLVVAPTGSGKTCMGAEMTRGQVERGGRVVWLVHRRELVTQSVRTLLDLGLDVGWRGREVEAPVQVCTIQALVAAREVPDDIRLVIVDEAHHMAKGGLWAELVRTYLRARARLVGLTATPARADDSALEGFDAIVVAAQIGELQRLGHLVALKIKRPGHLLKPDKIAQRPVDAYLEHARGRSAVVFAPHVKAAEEYASDFRGLGIAAEVVTAKTKPDVRVAASVRFCKGELQVLVGVGVFTEGWDAPICSCVILGRGCGSISLLRQMTGRGLRPSPGKSDCLLLDLRGVTHAFGRPDEDCIYALEGSGIALARPIAGPRLCRVCQLPLGDLLVCPECSAEHDLVTPAATGEKLVDYDEVAHEAVKSVMRPRRDVLSLSGMIVKYGEAKGLAMFRHIFKRDGGSILGLARAFNRSKASARAAFDG